MGMYRHSLCQLQGLDVSGQSLIANKIENFGVPTKLEGDVVRMLETEDGNGGSGHDQTHSTQVWTIQRIMKEKNEKKEKYSLKKMK